MKIRLAAATTLALAALFLPVSSSSGAPLKAPPRFFGVAPQTALTDEDASYMQAGGIGTVRLPLVWEAIQPTASGGYQWGSFDQTLGVVSRARLRVLPSIGTTPRWLARKGTTLPVHNARQRAAWTAFLQAAVARYGPHGTYWVEHAEGTAEPVPKLPIREWQIWNEPNFFYFAYPVSPSDYAKLVSISSKAIKRVEPRADVVLAGLFGEPTAKGKRGMPAADFLARLYQHPGLKQRFDGVALHPYAVDSQALEEMVELLHDVTVENRDRVPLYITEMGWGSQNDFNQVAFEQGIGGQVRQLRSAYTYLLSNRRRLNVAQVHWFSWKDIRGSCSFCDSVGFFREGPRFKAKPAWHAFVALTGGKARP
jgi:hypothetical protein